MLPLAIGCAALVTTMLGGSLSLKLSDRLHLILGFSAGAVVAVAFFDLLPQALHIGISQYELSTIVAYAGFGFLFYLLLDQLRILHSHADNCDEHGIRAGERVRAGWLSLHSFLDGVGIGLAFQVSTAVGIVVGIAVLAHDFSDGVNTVSIVVKNGGDYKKALQWLIVDAIAPVLGVYVTTLYTFSNARLCLLLALFAGFFLYIGASDFVPQSYRQHPKLATTFMTFIGAILIGTVIHYAG